MGRFFKTKNDAVVWLVVKGWRQNRDGVWLKGKRRADLRSDPVFVGEFYAVFSKDTESTREEF